MLIHYLEKSLLFNQVETHLYKNEHIECEENFELLTPHNCKTMEMKKQEKSSLLNQYNHDLSNVMNEEEPSSSIIQKIKIATEHIVNYTISEKLGLIAAYGENSDYISIWKYDFETENIKGALSPAGIISFPDLEASKDELAYFEWDATQEYLLVAFTNGRLYFLNSSREIKSIIQLEPGLVKGSIVWNPYSTEALSVGYSGSYMIIDPVNEKVFHNKQQNLKGLLWQNQENYAALTEDNSISLYSINQENPIEVFAGDEGTEAMKFSKNSLFLATFSSKMNAIKIWIMNSKNYLYCFTDPEKICDFIWNDNDGKFFK